MLAVAVQIGDILDAEAFVQATINRWQRGTRDRGRIEISEWEREELVSEGLAILYRLKEQFQTRLDGYAQDGRFSGYASMFLPRKLGDAWHRMHAEHQLRTQEDGGRRWVYGEKAVSLEALTAEDPDRHFIMTSPESGHDLAQRIHGALLQRSRIEREHVVQIALRIARDQQPTAIANELGMHEDIIRRHMRTIVRAAPTPRHVFTKVSELRAALEQQAERDADLASQVGALLSDGATVPDVADLLQIETSEVRDHEGAIRRVWHQIETGGQ